METRNQEPIRAMNDDAEVLFALQMACEHDINHQAQALRTWLPRITKWYESRHPSPVAQGEAQTPSEQRTFVSKVRSTASYLRANYKELYDKDSEVIAKKLEECATYIEQLEARHPSHPTGSEPHALASAETDTKMLAAWTAERYPGDYAPYFNLTMVRHQGDLVLTVRLPTVYGAPPGAVSRVRFNREMWKEFMKIVASADTVFKACDELDASAL